MEFEFDFSVDAWLTRVRVSGTNLEDAKERLMSMSLKEILEDADAIEKSFDIKNLDSECVEKTITVKVKGIEYDVEEEDVEGTGESVEDVLARLPKELEVTVDLYGKDEVEYPDDRIADEITDQTNWLIHGFESYEIIKEE